MAKAEAGEKQHKFWDQQPVPRIGEVINPAEEGPIDPIRTVAEVQAEPYKIPDAFEWFTPDVNDPAMLEQIYLLLAEHYVEDDDQMFRFNYPPEFILWALTPPHWHADWHVGVRVKKTGKLVGFISGVPSSIAVRKTVVPMTEINFLCVHKNIRDKRLAPVLIKEVTRRVNLQGVWQAVYTAGIVLPRPIARCQYWHRSLNPQKLIAIGFSRIPPHFEKFQRPMDATKRHFQLPATPQIPNIRAMEERDVKGVQQLLNTYLSRFTLAPHLSEEETRHWLLPRPGVISSYLVETNGTVTDFLSFYTLPSTIIGNPKYNQLKAAYSYYNVATTVDLTKLMNDALILARQQDFDVFNALDIMENKEFLKELKFGIGDGHLQYYLYNWRCADIQPEEVGLVML
eukprot:TRINITY_DN10192_c0_g1_i1.p1 TRINITY_DN10192_c0_g1~~TRINITY_DN10192_c0_g1_i1.p1  ORF type:complete len:399 (+),score=69.82 TRINITY_DN10192_c0_g1_i1:48-1244(+)